MLGQRPVPQAAGGRVLGPGHGMQGSGLSSPSPSGVFPAPPPLAKLAAWEVSPARLRIHSVLGGCPQTGPHPGHRRRRTPSISNSAPDWDSGQRGCADRRPCERIRKQLPPHAGTTGESVFLNPATSDVVVTPRASISGSRPHSVFPPRGLCFLIKSDLRIY